MSPSSPVSGHLSDDRIYGSEAAAGINPRQPRFNSDDRRAWRRRRRIRGMRKELLRTE